MNRLTLTAGVSESGQTKSVDFAASKTVVFDQTTTVEGRRP